MTNLKADFVALTRSHVGDLIKAQALACAQYQLKLAARRALDYYSRKTRGALPIGMYEDVAIGRELHDALEAIDDAEKL